MKRMIIAIILLISLTSNAQVIRKTETIIYSAKGEVLQTTITKTEKGETVNLKGVTFGLSMGISRMFDNPKEYFLTTDTMHKLQIQDLSRTSVVLSSMLTIRLTPVAMQDQSNGTTARKVLVNRNKVITNQKGATGVYTSIDDAPTYEQLAWYERFAINISLNLAEINSGNVAFNKSIDGGIGLGFYFNENTQVGLFYDILRIRQMRNYFVHNFTDKPIPNGTNVYTALDQNDNNLFYNKYYSGLSFKVIFSLGTK